MTIDFDWQDEFAEAEANQTPDCPECGTYDCVARLLYDNFECLTCRVEFRRC